MIVRGRSTRRNQDVQAGRALHQWKQDRRVNDVVGLHAVDLKRFGEDGVYLPLYLTGKSRTDEIGFKTAWRQCLQSCALDNRLRQGVETRRSNTPASRR